MGAQHSAAPPTRRRPVRTREAGAQTQRRPLILASMALAAMPTCALVDFVGDTHYQLCYGFYGGYIDDTILRELALMTADRLTLFAFAAIWAAITNRTAAKEPAP